MAAIRALVAADGAAFRRLRLEGLALHPEAFGESHAEAAMQDEAAFAARLRDTAWPDAVFGAFDGSALVGLAGFVVTKREKARHKGQLWGVYVAADQRRQGVGAALVGCVIHHARAQVEQLLTAVVVGNDGVRALYLRLGFRPYGVEPRALRVNGRYFDEELLQMTFHSDGAAGVPR
ncbi:GNAT family N-acetyltransferase [Roseomonas sp. BN140053]|uniref:GNAT family N-acetyltransferase n=1 Tax=Roseomonas sp. BN140053 TaxID=3391898 RepID=UPI0039E9F06B